MFGSRRIFKDESPDDPDFLDYLHWYQSTASQNLLVSKRGKALAILPNLVLA